MGQVKISIQFEDHPTETDFCFRIPFDTMWMRDALRTIDVPRLDSDALTATFLCTNPVVRKQISIQREEFAKIISDSIIEGLEQRDTICGNQATHEKDTTVADALRKELTSKPEV